MSRQAHEKEFRDGRNGKPKPYEVGVQISCGVHPQVPQKDVIRGKQVEYKTLTKAWELLTDDAALKKYVQSEVRSYLEAI